jgi:hypothetical protein
VAKDIERQRSSFAEAEGRVQYPDVLKWGELDQRIRAALWNRFWIIFDTYTNSSSGYGSYYNSPLKEILLREYVKRRHGFANEFQDRYSNKEICLAHWADYFRTVDYIELFDFITFFLRDSKCPSAFVNGVAETLNESWSPYRLHEEPPTIYPAVSTQEATAIKRDLSEAFNSKFGGAKVHLQSALDALNKGDHRAVVRESIHAVESAVRDFTSDPNALLSRALKKLTDESNLHPALANAFEKLYAYTSDEQGIRHALVFGENDKVGFEEAIFFVSACSAFIGLLSRKANSAS